MSKLFESNWNRIKQTFCEGKDLMYNMDGTANPNKKKVMEIVLENTRRELTNRSKLMETSTAGATSSGNVATLNRVIMPIIRRVMPTVIANEIIGVQPMTGPVAQIHTLRVRYADSVTGGITAGSEALSPFDIARYYSGNENVSLPAAAPTSYLEGRAGNRLNIEILKETVEAKSRRLSSRWTFEAAQDAQAQQGIDIEAEIMAVLAQEITAEIDQEILMSLRRLPGTATSVYDQSSVSGTATYVGDEHAALAVLINRQANLIASRTRRGAGNWIVVSPTALTILQSATTSAFARTTEGVFEAPTNTKFAGTLNNSMRVYVDQFAADNTPVLVGYKGPGETDAAAYYCPYVPLTSSGVVIDPQTFEPVVSFLTRYGYLELSNSSSSFGNAADYLGLVGIDTSNLKFL
jgi:Major capsid protein Gp23